MLIIFKTLTKIKRCTCVLGDECGQNSYFQNVDLLKKVHCLFAEKIFSFNKFIFFNCAHLLIRLFGNMYELTYSTALSPHERNCLPIVH